MKFPVLWSGITHSVLGAPVNTTCYIKKIVNCDIKQSGKVPHKVSFNHRKIFVTRSRPRYAEQLKEAFANLRLNHEQCWLNSVTFSIPTIIFLSI